MRVLTAKDIPGENSFMCDRDVDFPEEVCVSVCDVCM